MSLKKKLGAVDSDDKAHARVVKQRLCDLTEAANEDLTADGGFTGASGSDEGKGLVKQGIEPPVSQMHIPTDNSIDLGAHDGKKFVGKQIGDLYILEICAGSARLSKAALDMGFMALAIDHKTTRSCGVPIQVWDLEDPNQLQLLLDFIEAEGDKIAMVWMAPSCGTASRARGRRQPRLEAQGVKVPVPLRSVYQPDQIDGLGGTDKIKTERANILYKAIYDIALLCHSKDIFTAIENPFNSHFWSTTPMQELNQEVPDHKFVSFHNCCHGGDRDKLTSLWVNKNWLDSLEGRCDKQHSHKSWAPTKTRTGVNFPTSEEAAYPHVLCARIISLIAGKVEKMGARQHSTLQEQMHIETDTKTDRIVLGCLPRGNKVKPLVAEYGNYILAFCNPQNDAYVVKLMTTLPKGAKIVSRRILSGDDDRDNVCSKFYKEDVHWGYNKLPVEACTIGVPSDPINFLKRAVKAGHPKGLESFVSALVKEAAIKNFHSPPHELAMQRVAFFKKWNSRAMELAEEERAHKAKLPKHCSDVLAGKRLLLFREILQSIDYPDTELINHMGQGFELSGWMHKSGVFLPGNRRPAFDKDTLKRLAKGLNRATLAGLGNRQESDLERGAWEETVNEIHNGWLWKDEHPDFSNHVVAHRFGLQQGSKIRVIDNCSCCGLNGSVGLKEKFKLHTVDQLAAMISHSFSLCKGSHPKMLGRTYDLKAAYKQFPVCVADRNLLRIGVNEPGVEEPHIMGINVLPFGAVGSVAAFLRISVAIWCVGLKCLSLYWSAFYDDFSVVTRTELQKSTSWSCESLFTLLGMQYANSGSKCVPFSERFKMLGLVMDLSRSDHKQIFLGHTKERSEELTGQIKSYLSSGKIGSKEAERLRGRLLFFESFTFGRLAGDAVKAIGRVACGNRQPMNFDQDVRNALEFLLLRVQSAKPIVVTPKLKECWLIFTDGACEAESSKGSIGGVLITPHGECLKYFSSGVPAIVMDELMKHSKNPIHELEVLPVVISLWLWADFVKCAPLVHYIDNESSRMALIKGVGETSHAARFIKAYVNLESEHQVKTWFARVPSHSNVGDGPSRDDISLVTELGAVRTNLDWERIAELLL